MALEETTVYLEPKPDPKDRIEVEIGDSKQPEFLPQVKVMRWDNEVNLSVRLVHDELAPVIVADPDKVEWSGERQKLEFYELPSCEDTPNGGTEVDLTLFERPAGDRVQFTINTKGVRFEYQPALTEEEIGRGRFRPANVVGSWAIYATEEKVNLVDGKVYGVGKVGHIFNSLMSDAAGNAARTNPQIFDNGDGTGLLTINFDKGFLDNAVYPIRHAAGLTIGYNTVGSSFVFGFLGYAPFTRVSPTGAANVDSISIYANRDPGQSTSNNKAIIWKASDNTVLANSPIEKSINSDTGQWWTYTYSTKPVFAAANFYLGVISAADNKIVYRFDSDGGSYGSDASVFGGTYASPGNLTPDNYSVRLSIYATYTPTSQSYTLNLGGSVTPSGTAVRGASSPKAGSVTSSATIKRAATGIKSAAVTCVTVLAKAGSRMLAGSATAVASAVRQAQKPATASSTASTTLRRSTAITLSSSTTPAAAAIRKASVTKSGSLTPQGVAIRSVLIRFACSVSPNGVISKLANHLLGGSVTPQGDYTSLMVTILSLFASVTPSGAITQVTRGRVLNASVTPATSIAKSAQHLLASSVTAVGTAITVATYIFVHYLTASVTAAGTARRDASATKAASVTASGVGVRSAMRALLAALSPEAVAVRNAQRRVHGSVTAIAAIGIISVFLLDLAASVTASTITRISSAKNFVRTVLATGKAERLAQRHESGSVTPAAVYNRKGIVHPMRTVIASSGVLRIVNKFAFALILPTGKAGRLAQRYENSTVVPVALASRFGALLLNLTASVAPEAWIWRSADKRVNANVPAAGFVLGLADKYLASSVEAESDYAASKYTPYGLAANVTATTATRKAVTKHTARIVAPIGQAIRKASRRVSGAVTAFAQLFGFSRKGVIRMRTDVYLTTRINTRVYVK